MTDYSIQLPWVSPPHRRIHTAETSRSVGRMWLVVTTREAAQ